MRGYFLFTFCLAGLLSFSFFILMASNLFIFWLFLELCTLCLVPMFFLDSGRMGLSGLFSYLIVSSVSSSFLVGGMLFEAFLWLFLLGLLIKFGIFPFLGWVYMVVNNSNWYVVWGLSTVLKIPFFIIPFFIFSFEGDLVSVACSFSFASLLLLFWLFTNSWTMCWCHMMLSSSAALIVMSCGQPTESLSILFSVYFIWASLSILFISTQEEFGLVSISSVFLFSFFFLSFPFSFSIFYKFLMTGYMFSCYVYVFISWVAYTVSEQLYLMKFLVDTTVPRSVFNGFFFV